MSVALNTPENFLVYPNLISADAVVAETRPSGTSLADLAAYAATKITYIGFSSDGKMYTYVGLRKKFAASSTVSTYIKTGPLREAFIAMPSYQDCNSTAICAQSLNYPVITYPDTSAANDTAVTLAMATALGYTSPSTNANTILDGAWFLIRIKLQTIHATAGNGGFQYMKLIGAFNAPGCYQATGIEMTDARNTATPFLFKNGSLHTVWNIADPVGASLVWYFGNSATNIVVLPNGSVNTPGVVGVTKINMVWQANGRAAVNAAHTTTSRNGISYQYNCIRMIYANAGATGVSFPITDQYLEMVVPSDEWMVRDYIKNGPGKTGCCAVTPALPSNVATMCNTLHFTSTNTTNCPVQALSLTDPMILGGGAVLIALIVLGIIVIHRSGRKNQE